MRILAHTLIIFATAFLLHLLIWRIKLPKIRQTKILLEIFYVVLFSAFFIFSLLQTFNLTNYLHIFLSYTALVLAYIVTYSAVEVDSPSLVMINYIAKKDQEGLPKEEFDRLMTDDLLILPRLRDLLSEGLVSLDQNKYKLTSKGRRIIKIFLFYRYLLALGKGG
jgi:hypothetical protein